ncbi:hypothetical protein ACQ4PT_057263 [Festuca glaucescens]
MLPFHPDDAVSFYWPTDGKTLERNLAALRGKEVCGSSRGWLALVDVAANVTLLNPFTDGTTDLTPASNRLREACFRHVSIDFGRCQYIFHYQGEPEVQRVAKLGEKREVMFREIVLSSQPDSRDCVARSLSVVVCRVRVDGEWKLLDANVTCCIRSIVHCRGRKFPAIGFN